MKGKFIVVEGLDRAGKSSQCQILAQKLTSDLDQPVKELKFPDRTTPIGEIINKYLTDKSYELSDQAIHLLFSANRWEAVPRILDLLNSGTTLIVDRYVYSGIAFSAAKGLDFEWCKTPDIGLPEPDLVLFLDLSEDTAAQRGGYGLERYEVSELQNRVRKYFNQQKTDKWSVIDANQSFENVSHQIWQAVAKLF